MSDQSGRTQSVPQALGHLRVALDDAFRRVSRQHGLTPSQAELLCAAMSPVPIGQLARTLRCDRTNVTHMVARAGRHGWVERLADDQDRRSTLIMLTSEGERLATGFIAALEAQLSDLLSGWSPGRRNTTARLITEIATALDDVARAQPD